MPIQLVDLNEQEIRELGHAVYERLENLKKIRKKMLDAGLSTTTVDYHIMLLVGSDTDEGMSYKISSQVAQLDAMFESDVDLF